MQLGLGLRKNARINQKRRLSIGTASQDGLLTFLRLPKQVVDITDPQPTYLAMSGVYPEFREGINEAHPLLVKKKILFGKDEQPAEH
jgi:hypothetical protein